LDALLHCGLREPAHGSFTWLLRALENTHPRVQPIYRLSGEVLDHENELSLPGYRGSRPVREGNSAAGQLQLGAYGDLLYTAKLYTELGNRLDGGTGQRMAENVNLLCEIWRNEDASIWELNDSRHYTVSKMGSWLALRCALDLAEAGQLPDDHTKRWRAEQRAIEEFVEGECWSEERESYVMHPGTDSIDVACVLMGRMGYDEVAGERFGRTIDAVRSELVPRWPFVHRYSGMQSEEGAFVACTFWLVEALAHMGKADEAAELMEGALGIANHVGLLSEEVDPSTGELLGNFPQALSHLALINAAAAINNR
jgi:GH15 family glucan-1,4-alpha-glucosidase